MAQNPDRNRQLPIENSFRTLTKMSFDISMGSFFLVYFGAVMVAVVAGWFISGRKPDPQPTDRQHIARNTRRLFLAMIVGFLGIGGGLVYWQILRGRELVALPQNPRILANALRHPRGRILDRQGRELVTNKVGPDGIVQRVYRHPELVHVTGFTNPRLGPTGVERSADAQLIGRTVGSDVERIVDGVLNRSRRGDDVVLTIDLEVQAEADAALGTAAGAAVLLDPRSGEVLALASRPWFDPNRLTYDPEKGTFSEEAARVDGEWAALRTSPEAPLVNRAVQSRYPPGSTYKTVTLAAALELGIAAPDDRFSFTLKPPDEDHAVAWHETQFVTCQNHPHLAEFSLAEGYAWSCNVVFSDLALEMGPDRFTEFSRRFGIDAAFPFDLPITASMLTTESDYFAGEEGVYGLAATGIGQGKLAITPMQMALVASVVAFGGVMRRPRLLKEIRDVEGSVVKRYDPENWRVPISPQTAEVVKGMMVQGVENGWASKAAISGVVVGGKTGTAELGGETVPHSWFIGLAPAEAPRFVVAVVKENSGFGSEQAAPVGRRILEAGLAAIRG